MRLQKITWKQARNYFNKNDIVIIGIGSCECHGTHLPLGTDALVPDYIIDLIEEKIDVLIAPTLPYGSCDYFSEFPGTITLGNECLYQILIHITNSLFQAGARKFVIINGHGGNIPAIEMTAYEMSKKGVLTAIMNWWQMAGQFNAEWSGGHAGGQETAAIMVIDEKLIDWQALYDFDITDVNEEIKATGLKTVNFKNIEVIIPRNIADISDNGWIGHDHPDIASMEWGNEMLNTISDYIVQFIESFKHAVS
ncbi:MAG: creatininase family protein [Tissierellia bacterium]|nr:creatininase family protein [Tissierellia bacterium]